MDPFALSLRCKEQSFTFHPKTASRYKKKNPFCNFRCFSLCFFIKGFELKFCFVHILWRLRINIYIYETFLSIYIYIYISSCPSPPMPFYHFFARRRDNVNISLLQRFVTFIFLLPGALRWLVLVHMPAVNSHLQDSWAQTMLGCYPSQYMKGDSSSFDRHVW